MPLDSEDEVAEEEWEDPMSSPAASDGGDSEDEDPPPTPGNADGDASEEEGLFIGGAGPS
jgi:hypothetical protein